MLRVSAVTTNYLGYAEKVSHALNTKYSHQSQDVEVYSDVAG
jgi:hypothetical protein